LLQTRCSKKQFAFTFSLFTKAIFFSLSCFLQQSLPEVVALPGSAILFHKKLSCVCPQGASRRGSLCQGPSLPQLCPLLPCRKHMSWLAWPEKTISQICFCLEDNASRERVSRGIWNCTYVVSFSLCMKCLWQRSYWFYSFLSLQY